MRTEHPLLYRAQTTEKRISERGRAARDIIHMKPMRCMDVEVRCTRICNSATKSRGRFVMMS